MTLRLATDGDTRLIVTRHFKAPPAWVFRAHTEAGLLKKWLLGPPGWRMTDCLSEAWPGGRLFFRWASDAGEGFYLAGEYLAIEAPYRILHVERMHLPDPTPDNRVQTDLAPLGGGTRLTLTMTLPDSETRAAMLATGMEHGMEASYARLDDLTENPND